MTGRAKQPRRTPHSSSGNIAFGVHVPDVSVTRNAEYTHHNANSNASLPSLSGAPTSGKTPSPQERIITNLVSKLSTKLPYYSGSRISELEENESVSQIISALIQLSQRSINVIILTLCGALDKLAKKTNGSELNQDIIESEIFLVRIIIDLLTSHWNTYLENRFHEQNGQSSSPNGQKRTNKRSYENLRMNTISPVDNLPALEDNVAHICLLTMKPYLRRSGPIKADDVRSDRRLGTYEPLPDSALFDMDAATLHSTRSVPLSDPLGKASQRSPDISKKHSNMSGSGGKSVLAMYIPSALAVRASNIGLSDAPALLVHLAGQVIHRLSAMNWANVYFRIHNKIRHLASIPEETDILDLRYVTYCYIDKTRLVQVMQELPSLLMNMQPGTQAAVTVIMRSVVWNWIQDCREEFVDVLQAGRRRLDGWPERLYDLLHSRVDQGNRAVFWPTLAILLAISPDRLKDAEAGSLAYGVAKKHNNFLEQLQVSTGKLGESVIQCYNDLCGAAFQIPPSADVVLRMLAPDFVNDLERRLINPQNEPPFYDSYDAIDIELYSEALLNILRYHSAAALSTVLPQCLEPRRSVAVKLCVVRALTMFVTEAPKFPWQTPLDLNIYNSVAPRLRVIINDIRSLNNIMSLTPGMLGCTHDSARRELITSIQALWRLDVGFLFTKMTEREFPTFIGSPAYMFRESKDEATQVSTFRTFGSLLSRLYNPPDEHYNILRQLLKLAVPSALRLVSEQLLREPDDAEENKRCLNLILAVLTQLADTSMEGRQDWKYGEARNAALAITDIAVSLLLTAPRLDICMLAAKSLRLLVAVDKEPFASPLAHYTTKQAQTRFPLMEAIGDPKYIVMGRVEFQKRMRLTLGPRSIPCLTNVAVWKESYHRWLALTPLVVGSAPRSSLDRNGTVGGPTYLGYTNDERKLAWDNLTLMLAATAMSCTSDDRSLTPPSDYGIPSHSSITDEKCTVLLEKFLTDAVGLLDTPWVPGQIMCRDAIGLELAPQLVSRLFAILERRLRESIMLNANLAGGENSRTVLVDQIIYIFKALIERIGDDSGSQSRIDAGETLTLLSRLIHEAPNKASEYRIKSRFCAVLDMVLEKKTIFYIRQNGLVRNRLLETVADWILDGPHDEYEDEQAGNELLRALLDSNLAALKTSVKLCENLCLEDGDGPSGDGTFHVASRLFFKYFGTFISVLEAQGKSSSSQDLEQTSQSDLQLAKQEAQIFDLVVTGISNMLQANKDPGIRHVLTLAYDEHPRLRSIFIHVFCNVLDRGTKFSQYSGNPSSQKFKNKLCEMLKGSESIARAVVDACPMTEIDNIVPVLLNIFDNRRSLLGLLKMVVKRQTETVENATDVFRFNDMCSRLYSAFAKAHGYNYLRTIISPLITAMTDFPDESGYELDPSKIKPGQTREQNARNLERISTAFLQVIVESLPGLPQMIREACRIIEEAVTAVWPDGRHAVVGAFLFLRFIVPAVVSPESIDIELPKSEPQASTMRRGLLLVAKVIQSLANNIQFGKEAHMTLLNHFLSEGLVRISRFYTEVLRRSSDETPLELDASVGLSYDESDMIILHRFFQKQTDKIGRVILVSAGSKESPNGNKRDWDKICDILLDAGSALDPPNTTNQPSNQHQIFRSLMAKHGHKNTEPVRDIFVKAMALDERNPVFILALSKIDIETIDFELLMFYAFKIIKSSFVESFDVIIDCTAFTNSSEIPLSWYKILLEHIPVDLQQSFETAYIVNPNAAVSKFFKKLYHLAPDFSFAKQVISVGSLAELTTKYAIHPGTLVPMRYAREVESEQGTLFSCQQHVRDHLEIPVTMFVGVSHLRIISVKPQRIHPNLSGKTVEVIPLADISDVCLLSSQAIPTLLMLRRVSSDTPICFSIFDRDNVAETIEIAKSRVKSRPITSADRSRLTDITASLLNVGLFNVCDEDEILRSSAFNLLYSVCKYVNYNTASLAAFQGPFIPPNIVTSIVTFNERMAKFLPQITPDMVNEFSIAFEKASTMQKLMCLQYLNPWIKNLSLFANPSHELHDASGLKLLRSIRTLVDMTMKFPDVLVSAQRFIWSEIAKHDTTLLPLALNELMNTATEGGLGSIRCEQVADILVAMSSINVRARVLKALIRSIAKATGKGTRSITQSAVWNEISALTRLALASVYSLRLAVINQLYVPEVAHIVTLLCATGSTAMRTAVYGMAVNLIQSLMVSRSEHEGATSELGKLLSKASEEEMLAKFGLSRAYPTSDFMSVDGQNEHIPVPALEGITNLFIDVMTHGSGGVGHLNVWRARWMGLLSSIAFQVCPYVQYRAFIVMGLLASSGQMDMEDDIFYQILVAFKTALSTSVRHDSAVLMSILRCMGRVVPGLRPESRYLPQMFWLAIALLQTTYLPLYEEAGRFLEVVLEHMDSQGLFKGQRPSAVLLQARIPLAGTTSQLDDMMGLSFDTSFSFSVASIIFRGFRTPTLLPVAKRLLTVLLRITASAKGPNSTIESIAPLDHDAMGYFLALLPSCGSSSAYRDLLLEAGLSPQWCPLSNIDGTSQDSDTMPVINMNILGLSSEDETTALLTISFLFAILDSFQGAEQQKSFIFGLLAQLAAAYPDISALAVVHYLSSNRSEWLLNIFTESYLASEDTLSSVQQLFKVAMASPAWELLQVSPNALSEDVGAQKTPHFKALNALNMYALSSPFKFLGKGEAWTILEWISGLVEVMIEAAEGDGC